MHTVRIKNTDDKALLKFLQQKYGQHGTKIWECKDSINAVFYHQQYLAPSYSIHLVSILVEYDRNSRNAICLIYAGDARNKKHDTMSTEDIEEHIGRTIRSELQLDMDILRNRRYCAHCGKWDTYDLKQDQYVVTCKRCGLDISLEQNK